MFEFARRAKHVVTNVFQVSEIASLKAALGFLPGNERSTQASESHCYGFIYTVRMLDLVRKQTGYWVHCELLGERGDTKCACVYVCA